MRIPRLTHPIEQPYHTRWLTEIFYVLSFIIIILLALLNLALVGYDTVTVLAGDPNITYHDNWWAPESLPDALKFGTKIDECQPTELPRTTPLKTNSSLPLFSYALITDFKLPSTNAQSELRSQIAYKANPLDRCRVRGMSMIAEAKARAFQITSSVQCNSTEDIQGNQTRVFEVTFSRAQFTKAGKTDTILDYLAFEATSFSDGPYSNRISRYGPPQDPFLNVLGILDALGRDLIFSFDVQVGAATTPANVEDAIILEWDGSEDYLLQKYIPRLGEVYVIRDGIVSVTRYEAIDQKTKINMFLAVRDAIHLDLGYVSPTNIYTNRTAFVTAILPDDVLSNAVARLQSTPYVCSWAWGCLPNVNTTWARELTSSNGPINNLTLPISPATPIYPSVISMVYLCPQYRRKSWGSLMVSVFIGTFTMYATLYGIFGWLAPKLDESLMKPQKQEPSKYLGEEPKASDALLGEPINQNSPLVPALRISGSAEELPLHDYPNRRPSAE